MQREEKKNKKKDEAEAGNVVFHACNSKTGTDRWYLDSSCTRQDQIVLDSGRSENGSDGETSEEEMEVDKMVNLKQSRIETERHDQEP